MTNGLSTISKLFWSASTAGAVLVLVWPEASTRLVTPPWSTRPLPLSTIALACGMLALALVTVVRRCASAEELRFDPILPVVVCVSGLALAGAVERQITYVAAAVLVGLACAAFVSVWLLLLTLWRGEAIEYEGRWGGIGGDMGGWRLSRGAGLALLSMALVAASVAVLQSAPPPGAAGSGAKAGAGATDKGGAAVSEKAASTPVPASKGTD